MKKLNKKIAKLREYLDTGSCHCKKNCFECCTKIFFHKEEKQRMDQYLRNKGVTKPPNGKGEKYCEYLNEQGICAVYPERPIVCRAFGIVDAPFCRCDKTTKEKRIKETIPLKQYMASKMEFNKGYEYGDELMDRLKDGDLRSIIEVLYHTISLFSTGQIKIDDVKRQLTTFETIYMEKKNKSLRNEDEGLKELFNELDL